MSIQLFLLIIAVLFVILVAFLIPLIIYAKKTLMSLESFIRTTQESLNPLLSETKTTMERLNNIAKDIEDSTKNVQHLTKAIGEIGVVVEGLNNFVKNTGLSFSLKAASLGIGIKTALSTFAKGILKKASTEEDDA